MSEASFTDRPGHQPDRGVPGGQARVPRRCSRRARGRLVFVSSVVGLSGGAGQANYAASKAGLVGLSRSLARELGSRGITSNVVAPGYVDTDMTAGLPTRAARSSPRRSRWAARPPPTRSPQVMAFLPATTPSYVTGAVLPGRRRPGHGPLTPARARRSRATTMPPVTTPDTTAVRAWARENGLGRGRARAAARRGARRLRRPQGRTAASSGEEGRQGPGQEGPRHEGGGQEGSGEEGQARPRPRARPRQGDRPGREPRRRDRRRSRSLREGRRAPGARAEAVARQRRPPPGRPRGAAKALTDRLASLETAAGRRARRAQVPLPPPQADRAAAAAARAGRWPPTTCSTCTTPEPGRRCAAASS